MPIEDEIRAIIAEEVANVVPDAIREALGALLQGDRRRVPRGKRAKGTAGPKRTCPVPGCKNGWTPSNGGYCKDHLKTAGYRKWKANKKR